MREISFEIRSFLKEHIQSVWQLDLLITLMTINEPKDIQSLARILYLTPTSIEFALQKYIANGLVVEIKGRPSTFLFAPRLDEKRRVFEETAKVYAFRRVDVINLIFSNPHKQSFTG